MSETVAGSEAAPAPAPAPAPANPDREARARVMGWKPKEYWRGDPDKWVDADEFLDRGFASPAIMVERVQTMSDRLARQERDNQKLSEQFREARDTIGTLTTMMRTSEERAYKRARSELEAERTRAVEAGDTATFSRVDTELRELERTAPQTTTVPVQPPPQQQRTSPTRDNPEVQAFYQRNPWYSRDPELTQEADIIHTGLLNARPDMSVAQNLAEVERRLRVYYPDKFREPERAPSPPNGQAVQQHQQQPDNPRRDEPGSVSPSGNASAPRRQQNRRSFANMPQESKVAYAKYKRMLEGHGEPLTEQEWADDYWAQFPDDGT